LLNSAMLHIVVYAKAGHNRAPRTSGGRKMASQAFDAVECVARRAGGALRLLAVACLRTGAWAGMH
jgi:hypothetical protein